LGFYHECDANGDLMRKTAKQSQKAEVDAVVEGMVLEGD